MTDEPKLIDLVARVKPEAASIAGGDYLDLIWSVGSPIEALFYGQLFWPQFTVVHGCVFLDGTIKTPDDEERIAEFVRRNGGDHAMTEQALNSTTLVELFEAHASELDDAGFWALASILAKTWYAALAEAFPDASFVVETVEDPGIGSVITFYRSKNVHQPISPNVSSAADGAARTNG
jgi:hypothetical protein